MKAKIRWEEFIIGYAPTKIKVRSDWRVLDVGSGHNPFPRANVLLEKYIKDSTERSGVKIIKTKQKLVIGDVQDMPFPDKSFDFIIASHLAEHVEDPEAFCKELIRVGKAGYIESPGKFGERVFNEHFHRWYVMGKKNTLIFERIKWRHIFRPISDIIYAFYYYNKERPGRFVLKTNNKYILKIMWRISSLLHKSIHSKLLKNKIYTAFVWKKDFKFKVIK